ncbi:MAG TPA: hypothetical protein PLB90_12025 [Opitutaceae bacterium]|nr:hypothetical protein [Opitutaceae bacterium]
MRIAFYVIVVALVAVAGVAYLLRPLPPEEVTFSDFGRACADAEELMAKAAECPVDQLPLVLSARELPQSLKSPLIGFAFVRPDRLSLVTFSCPDYMEGVRFWKEGATIPEGEKPTRYRRVTKFLIDKDAEVKKPNQAPEPTPPSVTLRADARSAPAGAVAHL